MYILRIFNEFEIAAVSFAVGFPLMVLHRRRGRSEREYVGKRVGMQIARKPSTCLLHRVHCLSLCQEGAMHVFSSEHWGEKLSTDQMNQ